MLNELGDLRIGPQQPGMPRAASPTPRPLYAFGLRLLELIGDRVYGITGFLFLAFWAQLGALCLLVLTRF